MVTRLINPLLMKYRLPILCAAVAIILLSGCMTDKQRNEQMASWVGHDMNDLIAAWGAPNTVMSDGKGGQILIYDRSGKVVLPGSTTTTITSIGSGAIANSYSTPESVIPIHRQRMFWVDSIGRIYRWAWRGR